MPNDYPKEIRYWTSEDLTHDEFHGNFPGREDLFLSDLLYTNLYVSLYINTVSRLHAFK